MTIKQHGGVFGRNPTFNDVDIEGDLNVEGSFSIGGSVLSGLDFEGAWDANANSPDLTAITPTTGQFWIVDTAGTTDLDGITNWGIGDWALYDGSAWKRIEGGADGNFVNLDASGTVNFSGATVSDLGTVTTADIDGGSIDGVAIGANTPATIAYVDNVLINGSTVTVSNTDGQLAIAGNGAGYVLVPEDHLYVKNSGYAGSGGPYFNIGWRADGANPYEIGHIVAQTSGTYARGDMYFRLKTGTSNGVPDTSTISTRLKISNDASLTVYNDILPNSTGVDLGTSANAFGNLVQADTGRREIGTSTVNKMIEIYGRKNIDTSTVNILTFPSGAGFASANYTGYLSGELTLSFWGYNTGFTPINSKRKYHVSIEKFQTNNLTMNITEITDWAQDDGGVTVNPTLAQASGASATSTTLELSSTISSGTISELQVQIHFTALTQGTNPSLTWIGAEIAS